MLMLLDKYGYPINYDIDYYNKGLKVIDIKGAWVLMNLKYKHGLLKDDVYARLVDKVKDWEECHALGFLMSPHQGEEGNRVERREYVREYRDQGESD